MLALACLPTLAAAPALADLLLAINNRTCGVLTVHLPGASECGPEAPECYVRARNGFTTKVAVGQPFNDNLLRLTAEGECPAGNVKIAGACTVKIRRVTERVIVPGGSGSPFYDLELYVQAPATLVTVELTQGICDKQGGIRQCELACRSRDQQ